MTPDAIGPAIRALREQRGLSLEAVARKVGRTKQHVHNIESQKYGTPLALINEVVEAVRGRLFVEVRPAEENLEPAWVQPAAAEISGIAERLDEPRRERLLRAARAIASVEDPVALDLALQVLEHYARSAVRTPEPASAPEGQPAIPLRRK